MRRVRSRASEASRGGAPAQDDSGIGNVNQPRAPLSRVPLSRAPLSRAPLSRAPLSRAPLSRAPLSRAPLPRAPLPRVPLPRVPLPRAPLPRAPLPRAPLPRAPLPRVPLPRVPLSRAPRHDRDHRRHDRARHVRERDDQLSRDQGRGRGAGGAPVGGGRVPADGRRRSRSHPRAPRDRSQARRTASRRVAHRARAEHARGAREVPRVGPHSRGRSQAGAAHRRRRSGWRRCGSSKRSPTGSVEVEGLGEKRRSAIARAWREQRALRDVMVFLQAHGASPALALRIVRRYGASAMNVVAREPYRLALDVSGVGFKTADRIAATIGVAPDSPARMQAGVLQVVHDVTEAGHVWTSQGEVVGRAAQMLGLEDPDDAVVQSRLRAAIDAVVVAGRVAAVPAPDSSGVDDRALYAVEMYDAEVRLASSSARDRGHAAPRARRRGRRDSRVRGAGPASNSRRSSAARSRKRRSGRSSWSPEGRASGRRRSSAPSSRCSRGARIAVRLAAPTGRAAKRIAEATGAEAATLHRLLEFEPEDVDLQARPPADPSRRGAVVVDEASMLDLQMADALAQASRRGRASSSSATSTSSRASVPGAVLRDVIASRAVPCVRLTSDLPPGGAEPHRRPTRTASMTASCRVPPPGATDADFFIVERRDPERARDTIVELVTSAHPPPLRLRPRPRRAGAHADEPRARRGARAQRGAPGRAQPARRRRSSAARAPTASATR